MASGSAGLTNSDIVATYAQQFDFKSDTSLIVIVISDTTTPQSNSLTAAANDEETREPLTVQALTQTSLASVTIVTTETLTVVTTTTRATTATRDTWPAPSSTPMTTNEVTRPHTTVASVESLPITVPSDALPSASNLSRAADLHSISEPSPSTANVTGQNIYLF